jgi:hypothetical protein
MATLLLLSSLRIAGSYETSESIGAAEGLEAGRCGSNFRHLRRSALGAAAQDGGGNVYRQRIFPAVQGLWRQRAISTFTFDSLHF